ncbi:hypothetical protein [Lysobacter gummosus]|uniref:hypothetical protein n=1 Tax=Lysobacter gummosus TaxID=262324 RepID=UPI0036431E8F
MDFAEAMLTSMPCGPARRREAAGDAARCLKAAAYCYGMSPPRGRRCSRRPFRSDPAYRTDSPCRPCPCCVFSFAVALWPPARPWLRSLPPRPPPRLSRRRLRPRRHRHCSSNWSRSCCRWWWSWAAWSRCCCICASVTA